MNLWIELSKEDDGRWIAEVLTFDGVFVYGDNLMDAVRRAIELAYHVAVEDYGYKPT